MRLVFVSCSVLVSMLLMLFAVYLVLLNVVRVLNMGVCLCIVILCSRCWAFSLICDLCSLRC